MSFMWVLYNTYIFLYFVVLMLVMTLIVASLTLVERKYLALVQRRVGPKYVGYKGRLQYIADALKMFLKGTIIPHDCNKFYFLFLPSCVAAVCYSFWMNAVWGPSVSLFEIEYNLVYVSLFSIVFGICIVLTGYFSKNKYAMLSAVRSVIGMVNLEIFMGLMMLCLISFGESFSYMEYVYYQEVYWLFSTFSLVSGLIVITFLLEASRAPFDLSEAESELVAGYFTEYGSFFFALYYLGEYMHLFFFSATMVILFFGGWEHYNLIINVIFNKYNVFLVF